jgi:NAD(P)-dependent dehydrogenase (short-subunit alcohol dehydrogenase family)
MKLNEKVAIVTGAASGIGRAIAILYAKEDAKTVVSDIDLEGAKATVKEIKSSGGNAIAVHTDVSKEDDIQALVNTAVNTYGTVDILVNNAGIMDNFEPAADVTDAKWDKIFAVNIDSVMRSTRKVLPIFLAKGSGVIINIASVGGLYGSRAGVAYTASKFAVVGFTKNVGFQYAPKGIRCNAIAPGAVETNIGKTITEPNEFGSSRAYAGLSLNPRTGKPEEIAGVALFLASDDASFVNGAVFVADAGWTAY